MQRLIYLDLEDGYKSVHVNSKRDLQNRYDLLVERGDHIICILDSKNVIRDKCDCFDAHADFVQACYLATW